MQGSYWILNAERSCKLLLYTLTSDADTSAPLSNQLNTCENSTNYLTVGTLARTGLALRYGTTVQHIKELNGFNKRFTLRVGQQIRVS